MALAGCIYAVVYWWVRRTEPEEPPPPARGFEVLMPDDENEDAR